jgi:integrase
MRALRLPRSIDGFRRCDRSSVSRGRSFGLISWSLEIDGVKGKAFRDTAGPGVEGVTALKRQAAKHASPSKAARDMAIVRVLFDLALRRGEVAGLELEHFDARAGRAAEARATMHCLLVTQMGIIVSGSTEALQCVLQLTTS